MIKSGCSWTGSDDLRQYVVFARWLAEPRSEVSFMPDIPPQAHRKPVQLVLVPRRIDVLRREPAGEVILRMEVDNDVVMVPVGPNLAKTLIEGLTRAISVNKPELGE